LVDDEALEPAEQECAADAATREDDRRASAAEHRAVLQEWIGESRINLCRIDSDRRVGAGDRKDAR